VTAVVCGVNVLAPMVRVTSWPVRVVAITTPREAWA